MLIGEGPDRKRHGTAADLVVVLLRGDGPKSVGTVV
jgi:hypothetical protein